MEEDDSVLSVLRQSVFYFNDVAVTGLFYECYCLTADGQLLVCRDYCNLDF